MKRKLALTGNNYFEKKKDADDSQKRRHAMYARHAKKLNLAWLRRCKGIEMGIAGDSYSGHYPVGKVPMSTRGKQTQKN